jgi:uncharacterized protein
MAVQRIRLDAGADTVTAAVHPAAIYPAASHPRGVRPAAPQPNAAQSAEARTDSGDAAVRSAPATLLAHGAGGDLDGAGLTALAETIAAVAGPAVRTNLPYREAGRRLPPKAEASVAAYRTIRDSAAVHLGVDRWVVGGKSYGGRVASLAVAAGMPAAGLVFYGYPLHLAGRPERPRVDHWPAIEVPCLFLQGERDPLCDLDLLGAHLDRLGGDATVHVVEGGDHSLRVSRAASPDGAAMAEEVVIAGLADVIADWYRRVDGTDGTDGVDGAEAVEGTEGTEAAGG